MENVTKLSQEILSWPKIVKYSQVDKIKSITKKHSNSLLVVIGIGGSYLGAKAAIDALTPKFAKDKVMFVGQSLSSLDLQETLEFLSNEDFFVNVISKSGSTLETQLTFHFIKELMWEKYGEGMHERIIATTGKGKLRKEALANEWDILDIPENVGGRYSVFTPVGLFPMAVAGLNIDNFLLGTNSSRVNIDKSVDYALYRYMAYKKGKKIEVLSVFEPRLEMLGKWWEQLFGESEGKDGSGVFPVCSVYTRDLHSLGQLIQDGERNIFETMLVLKNVDKDLKIQNFEDISSDGLTVNRVNYVAYLGTKEAHEDGGVPTYSLGMNRLNEFTLGELMFFFMSACIVSASLLEVNPFDQPGVELYKQNIQREINGD